MDEHQTFGQWVNGMQPLTSKWCRSQWSIFCSPVILPYILSTIWWMNIKLWDNEWMGCNFWPQNESRSQWPIFHGPMILLLLIFAFKNILVLLARHDSSELCCPATALNSHWSCGWSFCDDHCGELNEQGPATVAEWLEDLSYRLVSPL